MKGALAVISTVALSAGFAFGAYLFWTSGKFGTIGAILGIASALSGNLVSIVCNILNLRLQGNPKWLRSLVRAQAVLAIAMAGAGVLLLRI